MMKRAEATMLLARPEPIIGVANRVPAAAFSALAAVVVLSACDLDRADRGEASGAGIVDLGPEHGNTVDAGELRALHLIGDEQGPGMLEQGVTMMMKGLPDGTIIVQSAATADGPLQLFRDGTFLRSFGRSGDGPGEYRHVGGVAFRSTDRTIWVLDRSRMVSFDRDGASGRVLNVSYAGFGASQPTFLPDGSLLLFGAGGTPENFGYLLHRYDFDEDRWSSFYPAMRDRLFQPAHTPHSWMRRLALAPEGKVLLVSHEYVIDILDPEREFAVEATVRRRPASWPEDPAKDHAARREFDEFASPFGVGAVLADSTGVLWVVTIGPGGGREGVVTGDPGRTGREVPSLPDFGFASLVEAIDLTKMEVIGSTQYDVYLRFLLAPGLVARYAGDLPYPRMMLIEVPISTD